MILGRKFRVINYDCTNDRGEEEKKNNMKIQTGQCYVFLSENKKIHQN